ncbi:TonB-dependent receptor [Xylophilus sp. GW821-FHT01B05]
MCYLPSAGLPFGLRLPLVPVSGVLLALLAAPATAQTAAEGGATLSEVQVRSDSGGYAAPQGGSAATRTDTPLRELPQSVRVIPRQMIEDLGATKLADTVDYVSGISRLNDFGGTWDNFAVRGFSSGDMGYLLNGFPGSRGYGPQRDAATIERIEFLKGPPAALYGGSEPGGTINVVTKKPQFTAANSAGLQIGTMGLRRATLDSTGPINDRLAYRLNLVSEDGTSRSPLVDNRRHVIAPALTWKLAPSTVLHYEAEFIRISTPLDRGVVQVNGQLPLPNDRFLGEPGLGNMRVNGDTHQFTLDHELAEGWRTRAGLSYRETQYSGNAADLTGRLLDDGRTLTRRDSWRSLPSRDTSAQLEVEGKFRAGGLGHTLLAGVEASRLFMAMDIYYSSLAQNPYAIDIYQPVYGQPRPALLPGYRVREQRRSTGLFVQDQIDLSDRWKLLLGARADRYHQDFSNLLNAPGQQDVSQNQSSVSPRAGLTWLASTQTSFYVSAGKSFRPNDGEGALDEGGRPFDPQRGRALEAGMKWESADQRTGATVALFDIRKNNVLTPSPTNALYSVAAGEVRSRGLETDVFGRIGSHWRISGNLALTDAKVTQDNNPNLMGKRLSNIPRVSGALLAIREAALARGGRWGLGGGVVHVGERSGNNTDSYRLPAYTTARLMGYWQVDARTRVSLDIHNLFDKGYYTASWNNLTALPGLRRQVIAGVQVKF